MSPSYCLLAPGLRALDPALERWEMVGVCTRLRLSTRLRFNTRLRLNILSESDVATSADRRECAEVSKARIATVADLCTHRHKQGSLWRRADVLSNNKLKARRLEDAVFHKAPALAGFR